MTIPTPHAPVPAPSREAARAAESRQRILTKPAGALGRLESASVWMAAVQDTCPPHPFTAPRLVIFAGDHGIARASGTSAYPPEVTAQMVANFVSGGAAANVLARQFHAHVRVVDVSVDAEPDYLDEQDPRVAAHRIRRGSGAIDREDAMTLAECEAALDLGARIAGEEIEAGADVLIAGDMGIGNTAAAAAIIALLTDSDPHQITGRGTGVDDATLARKRAAVAAAVARASADANDVARLLARISSPDIAAMVGFLSGAARRSTPVILDGVVSCAAALAAGRLAPGASEWWCAGHLSAEPAAHVALIHLGLRPLIDLDLRLGEGTGALLALPLLAGAAATLAEMATFESAGVTDREH